MILIFIHNTYTNHHHHRRLQLLYIYKSHQFFPESVNFFPFCKKNYYRPKNYIYNRHHIWYAQMVAAGLSIKTSQYIYRQTETICFCCTHRVISSRESVLFIGIFPHTVMYWYKEIFIYKFMCSTITWRMLWMTNTFFLSFFFFLPPKLYFMLRCVYIYFISAGKSEPFVQTLNIVNIF